MSGEREEMNNEGQEIVDMQDSKLKVKLQFKNIGLVSLSDQTATDSLVIGFRTD